MAGVGKDGALTVLHFSNDVDVGSLGPNSVASVSAGPLMTQRYRIIRMKGWVAGDALTSDIGPVVFGLTDDQLSLAEIDECMSAIPTRKNDTPMIEEAARAVFPFGAVFKSGGDGRVLEPFDSKDWPFSGHTVEIGDNIKMFAWNADQMSTLGANDQVNFYCKIWGVFIS